MVTMKFSRQREAILKYLSGTKEHPTADMVYENMRKEFPNISLGTVYRNLGQLADGGQILRMVIPGHPDRFDYTTDEHYHFICTTCGAVIDLPVKSLGDIDRKAGARFDGRIEGHEVQFFGTCRKCLK